MTCAEVRLGALKTHVWQGRNGRWHWHTYHDGKRVLRSAQDQSTAVERARADLRALRDGRAALLAADAATVSEFVSWRAQRASSPSLADAVAGYLAHREARGLDSRIICSDLAKFRDSLNGRLIDVTPAHVEKYLAQLQVGPRRTNNVRAALVSLFRWARMQGHLPDTTTAPERTHARQLSAAPVEILTPAQFCDILDAAPKEWRLGLAVAGLAGLRTEEVAGLRWEDIQQDQTRIVVRAEICKTRRRRFVPILPALAAWIETSKPCEADMVAPRIGLDALVKRLKRRGIGWVRNGLRHSFGSYRAAVLQSAGQVALEMGNSEAVVRRHYLEVQPLEVAEKWFDTRPKG